MDEKILFFSLKVLSQIVNSEKSSFWSARFEIPRNNKFWTLFVNFFKEKNFTKLQTEFVEKLEKLIMFAKLTQKKKTEQMVTLTISSSEKLKGEAEGPAAAVENEPPKGNEK